MDCMRQEGRPSVAPERLLLRALLLQVLYTRRSERLVDGRDELQLAVFAGSWDWRWDDEGGGTVTVFTKNSGAVLMAGEKWRRSFSQRC